MHPAGRTSTFKSTLKPMWGESICLTMEPSVPVCFEVRDRDSESYIIHNSVCAQLKLQREEQTILLPPARQGGRGPAYLYFRMPELDLEGIWPPPAAPALPPATPASGPSVRDVCLTQLGASGLSARSGQSVLQLQAFTRDSVDHNRKFESADEAKLRGRTTGVSVSSGQADWTERVCLSARDEICFELHAADEQSDAIVANENGDCYGACGSKNGACSGFCGTNGACCRVGRGSSLADCGFGTRGCPDMHCCKAASVAQPVIARGCGPIDPDASGEQTVSIPMEGDGTQSVVVRFQIDGRCASCEPRVLPTLVIPFFERDRCKMKLTANSIAVHGKRAFSRIYLIWLSSVPMSDYQDAVDELKRMTEPVGVPVHLMDFSPYFFLVKQRNNMGGWMIQQIFKLMMGYLVETDHYVIFDAKNHLVRDLQPDEYVNDCNQAVIPGEMRYDRMAWGWHAEWYDHSTGCLAVERQLEEHGDVLLPHSITPFVMNAATVRAMHARHNGGAAVPPSDAAARILDTNGWGFPYWDNLVDATQYLIDWFNGRGCTEFTSYLLYAYFGDVGDSCWRSRHVVRPFIEWSSSFWFAPSADSFDVEQQLVRAYAVAPELHPDWQVIGFQGSWNQPYPGRPNLFGIKMDLFKIFQRSGNLLYSGQSADDVFNLAQGWC